MIHPQWKAVRAEWRKRVGYVLRMLSRANELPSSVLKLTLGHVECTSTEKRLYLVLRCEAEQDSEHFQSVTV